MQAMMRYVIGLPDIIRRQTDPSAQNDLDLDLFCRDVIRADIEHLKGTPCRNVILDTRHVSADAIVHRTEDERLGLFGTVEEIFGECSA